jgi:hypothetical protein
MVPIYEVNHIVDRPSQSYHILEIPISLDSGIKRYAKTFVRIFKRTLKSTVKNQFPDGGRQSVHPIQCAHCVPPSSTHEQQYGDTCIPQALFCTITFGSPQALSFSKSGTSWNGNRIGTSASMRQTSRLAVFSDRVLVVVLLHFRPQSHVDS